MLTRDGRHDLDREIASTRLARCFLVVLFCSGGCLACGPLRQDVTSDPETQLRLSKDGVPIVYQSKRFTPIPLTSQQIDEFLSTASKAMPKGPSVWFILVRGNSKHDGELSYNVIVYFTPDETTVRLRKGRCLRLENWVKRLVETINKAFGDQREYELPAAAKNRQTDWTKRLKSYFQISQADRPFGKMLDVPNGSMLPFDAPEGFKADEIVDIVDFVRSNPTYTPPPSKKYPGSFREPIQHDGSAPIVVIEKKAGTIEVRTGTVEGPFSGIGQLLRIVRDGEDFRIIGTGVWVY